MEREIKRKGGKREERGESYEGQLPPAWARRYQPPASGPRLPPAGSSGMRHCRHPPLIPGSPTGPAPPQAPCGLAPRFVSPPAALLFPASSPHSVCCPLWLRQPQDCPPCYCSAGCFCRALAANCCRNRGGSPGYTVKGWREHRSPGYSIRELFRWTRPSSTAAEWKASSSQGTWRANASLSLCRQCSTTARVIKGLPEEHGLKLAA